MRNRDIPSRLQEIAPARDPQEYAPFGNITAQGISRLAVKLATSGTELGALQLGGDNPASLLVEVESISRGSGGAFYRPVDLIIEERAENGAGA